MITTGICPKTFAPIYPHYKSFDSYIKPQLDSSGSKSMRVVYLLIPTSNHNCRDKLKAIAGLYIFWFLHQTTTIFALNRAPICCISFDSYIKPQRCRQAGRLYTVVYLLIPTSNHNRICETLFPILLYIFWFLHQTTTQDLLYLLRPRCISFDSYIKPQPVRVSECVKWVVYLLIPTSNHNLACCCLLVVLLYIFWFLHQTTTPLLPIFLKNCCISFDSYIKPQLLLLIRKFIKSCISFDSYIKPQPFALDKLYRLVVYLLIPTSNHNFMSPILLFLMLYIFWFLHQTTTSAK